MERIVCAQTLTNLSVHHIDTCQVHHYATVIPVLYGRLWTDNRCSMAMLKLLVNLSGEQVLCTWLVGAECPVGLHQLLQHTQPEEVLVRASTLLANVCTTIDAAGIDWAFVQHEMKHDLLVDYSRSVLYAIRGPVGAVEFARKCKLLKYHPNEEISRRCQRILRSCADYVEVLEQRRQELDDGKQPEGGSVHTPTDTSDDVADESMASSSAHDSLVNFQ